MNEAVPTTRRELLARLVPASGAHVAPPTAHDVADHGKSLVVGANAPGGLRSISSRDQPIARLRGRSGAGNAYAASGAESSAVAMSGSASSADTSLPVATPPSACAEASRRLDHSVTHRLDTRRGRRRPDVDESNSLRSIASARGARACVVSHVQIRIHRSYGDHMASARSDASSSPRDRPD